MTKPLIGLMKDIASNSKRAISVTILTLGGIYLLFVDGSWWAALLRVLVIAAIIGVIATDTGRGLHHSKTALYTTVISTALWVAMLVDTIIHAPRTLFAMNTNSDGSFSIEIAPFVLVSVLLLVLALSGSIAYSYGRKRKDIKGVKKEKLFK